MLSKKNDRQKTSGKPGDSQDTPVQLAADGFYFGILKTEKPLRIDGQFTGVAFCDNKVFIGKNSKFQGDLICRDAVIEGVVEGNVMCSHKLWMYQNSQIKGKANVYLFENQEGAHIDDGVFVSPKYKDINIQGEYEKRYASLDYKNMKDDILAMDQSKGGTGKNRSTEKKTTEPAKTRSAGEAAPKNA